MKSKIHSSYDNLKVRKIRVIILNGIAITF